MFSKDRGVARRAHVRRVADGSAVRLPQSKQRVFLGDDDFVEPMAARADTASIEVPRTQRVQKWLAQHERTAVDHDGAIRAAYASGTYALKAIGQHFGLHEATVSRIAWAEMWQGKT